MNRKLIELLIRDKQYDVAQDLKIDFYRENFGSLYDESIRQLLQHTIKLKLRPDAGEWSFLFNTQMQQLQNKVANIKPQVLK